MENAVYVIIGLTCYGNNSVSYIKLLKRIRQLKVVIGYPSNANVIL